MHNLNQHQSNIPGPVLYLQLKLLHLADPEKSLLVAD